MRSLRARVLRIISAVALSLAIGAGMVRLVHQSTQHPTGDRLVLRAATTLEQELATGSVMAARLVPEQRALAAGRSIAGATLISTVDRPQRLSATAALALAQLESQPRLPIDALATEAAGLIAVGRSDDAVDRLETARMQGNLTLRFWLALSAGYYHRRRAGDFVRALDAADAGLAGFPDAALAFNASLAASHLLPAYEVENRWRTYLEQESNPGWRAIAFTHWQHAREQAKLAGYTRQDLAARVPLFATTSGLRSLVYDDLLPRWVDGCRSDSSGLALEELRVAGDLMTINSHDRYFADVAAAIPSAGCDRAQAALLQQFLDARRAYREDRRVDARLLFERLVPSLVRTRSPFALEARTYLVTLHYLSDARESAFAELSEVSALAAYQGYSHLRARAEWMRGYVLQDRRQYEASLAAYDRALAAYKEAGDRDGLLAAQTLRANLLDALGEYTRAWQAREQGLDGVQAVQDQRARYTMLSEAARAALRDRLPFASLAFADAAFQAARNTRSALRVLEAQVERARIAANLGRSVEARRMLREAERALADQSTSVVALRTRAALIAAEADMAAEPSERVQLLDRAIEDYRRAGADVSLARLHLARGRAHAAAGDDESARVDFADGIIIFEASRRTLQHTDFRLSYFEDAWSLFDEMIALCVRRSDLTSALEYALRARGRDLRDRLAAPARDTAMAIARQLPLRTDVLFYVVVERETIAWVFSRGAITSVRLDIPRTRIQQLVRAFRAALVSGERSTAAAQAHGMALHDALVQPLAHLIRADATLAIALDPLMQSIPFAALQRRDTGAFLIQEHEITMLPALWAQTPADTSRLRKSTRRLSPMSGAFVVGDPWQDPATSGPRLPALPQARAEASAIAALYPRARLLLGHEATRAIFVAEAGNYDVVHFAGHAQANPELPGLSRLVFASVPDGHNTLYAFEAAELRFIHTQVVVLAACETAGGRTLRSEGVTSLARAVMAAGVPHVIATLWAVSDTASRPLFEHLHGELRRGASVAAALQATQLWSLASSDPTLRSPAAWATLVAVGNAH